MRVSIVIARYPNLQGPFSKVHMWKLGRKLTEEELAELNKLAAKSGETMNKRGLELRTKAGLSDMPCHAPLKAPSKPHHGVHR